MGTDIKNIYETTDDFGTRTTARKLETVVMITTQEHISPPNHIVISIDDLRAIIEAYDAKS